MHRSNHRVLCTIAGFDPTGGAGVGVDLAVFEAFGAVGKAVVTVETEQDEGGVRRLGARDPHVVAEELRAVLDDDDPAGIKIGALGTRALAEAVAEVLGDGNDRWVVLDPVLSASAGGHLLEPNAVAHLVGILGSVVDVVTPNAPEADVLLGDTPLPLDLFQPRALAKAFALCNQGWSAALLKGGHSPNGQRLEDVLADGSGVSTFERIVLDGPDVRGTGCALSSAIAGYLAQGASLWTACHRAGDWVHALIAEAHAAGRPTLNPSAVALPGAD